MRGWGYHRGRRDFFEIPIFRNNNSHPPVLFTVNLHNGAEIFYQFNGKIPRFLNYFENAEKNGVLKGGFFAQNGENPLKSL